MKKILLPIDGSPRSLRTIQEIKQSYDPKETEITILLVTPEPRPHKMTDDNDEVKPMPDHDEIKSVDENDAEVSRQLLASFARMMPEYKVDTALRFGNPGPEIIGFAKEGDPRQVEYARKYLRIEPDESFNWAMIKAAMATCADTVILQMQDFLGLDNSARINTPSKPDGNWSWRIDYSCINDWLAKIIRDVTATYWRLPQTGHGKTEK